MTKYAPSIPFTIEQNDEFSYIKDLLVNVKQNFKMVLLTSPGEKLMNPDFGVGIRRYLFELQDGVINAQGDGANRTFFLENIQEKLEKEIKRQVQNYIPDLTVNSVEVEREEEAIFLKISFSYLNFFSDVITIN